MQGVHLEQENNWLV